MHIQSTFFGEQLALSALSRKGDPLEELNAHLDIARLVAVVEPIWRRVTEPKGPGGRKPWSCELMLRVLLLKRLHNLSDEQTEYQLNDRASYLRFIGKNFGDLVPDSRTIWLYGEKLSKAGGARLLFEAFDEQLRARGLMVKEGILVDATLVAVPKQRNNKDENALIKEGKVPEDWSKEPRKRAQKDVEARWTKKNHETHYGYKNHVKVSEDTKLICGYVVSPANVQDCEKLPELVGEEDRGKALHADSGYAGKPIQAHLDKHGVKSFIHEKGQARKPLTEEQKTRNQEKSKIRARVEHPFAFMTQSLGGILNRCIGKVRNAHQIGMMNLAYNLCRYAQLQRMQPAVG